MPTPEVLPPIDPVSQALVAFSPTTEALAEIEARAAEHTFDLSTTKGEQEARASRAQLVKLRTDLNEKRLELKRPLLAQGKALDEEAAKIEARIRKVEAPIDTLIKAKDAEREAARLERERQETARLKSQEAQLHAITMLPLTLVGKDSSAIAEALATLQATPHHWDEDYVDRGTAAKNTAIGTLSGMRETAERAEMEAEKIAAERAENERIAAEAAQRAAEREAGERRVQQAINDIGREVDQALAVDATDTATLLVLRVEMENRSWEGEGDERLAAARDNAVARLANEITRRRLAIEETERRQEQEAERQREQEKREREQREQEEAAQAERSTSAVIAGFNDIVTQALVLDADEIEEAARALATTLADTTRLPGGIAAAQLLRIQEAGAKALEQLEQLQAHQREIDAAREAQAQAAAAEALARAERDAAAIREREAAAAAERDAHQAEITWALYVLEHESQTIDQADADRLAALIRKLAGM